MSKELLAPDCINVGDTTWMMVATLLVLCMMPALSFFEAGLLRKKNSLSIISQIFMGVCVLTLLWYVFGFSIVFGKDHGGVIGDFSYAFFMGLEEICMKDFAPNIPAILFALFEMMFACITPLLMTGSFAERLKFRGFLWIIVIWEILVYYPIAHQIWGKGWLGTMGVLDFAGGITIHTTAGVSALIIALFLGRRKNFEKYHGEFPPHNVPLASIGACLLFVGWFGFNGGSSFSAGLLSTIAITNTTLAACISGATWAVLARLFRGHFGTVEILNGMIAGLAGITPASGYIHVRWAIIVGFIIGISSWGGIILIKGKLKIDDALDVSSVHGIPGMVGAIAIGFFASKAVNSSGDNGLFHGGGGALLGKQLLGILIAIVWSGIITLVMLLILKRFTNILEPIHSGLDKRDHGNTYAYDIQNVDTESSDEEKNLEDK